MRRRTFAATLAAIGFAPIAPGAAPDEVDRYLALMRELHQLPALVVALVRNGRLAQARASGLVDIERNVRAQTDHVFEIGSISKQFTAYAILMLKEEDKVALDAPVERFLDDLPAEWRAVTLHRLLTHTSGLPDLEEAFGYGVYRETPSDADFQARIAKLPLAFAPGEKWAYCNTNYWLLARVIERVSGMPYAQFMQARVFDPLRMRSTRSALPDRLLPHRAAGYEVVEGEWRNRDAIQPATGRGLGDIASSVADLARWEAEQGAPRLVRPETARLALEPVHLNDGSTYPYGYGWFFETREGQQIVQHDGQTAGFTAMLMRVPQRRLAVIVLCNVYGGPTEQVALHLARGVEPSLRRRATPSIADSNPALTRRVRELLGGAASADRTWQAGWFTAEQWSGVQQRMREITAFYRRIGALQRLQLIGRDVKEERTVLRYRVVYARLTRLHTFEFDADGRIAGRRTEDE